MKIQTCIIVIFIAITTMIVGCSKIEYPQQIKSALDKAGSNRHELEQAWEYFYNKNDSLKLKAFEFLIRNMDIHYTETYYWETLGREKICFSESDYPDFKSAVTAIDSLRKKHNKLHFKDTILHEITKEYICKHINISVDSWRLSLYKNIPFEDFYKYFLPYRVTIEPISNWLGTYQKQYKWLGDSLEQRSMPDILDYLTVDFKDWFTFTFGEVRNEPLSRLSAMQLLFRQKGECEDIAALETFILRSQSIPSAYISIPCWGTSFGAHFGNTVFDKKMNPLRFDVTRSSETDYGLEREPAKVLRYTYSRQSQTLAEQKLNVEIPKGYLRQSNYIDVTPKYWQTRDISIPLHKEMNSTKVVYAGVFNLGAWNPVWWGKCKNGFCNINKRHFALSLICISIFALFSYPLEYMSTQVIIIIYFLFIFSHQSLPIYIIKARNSRIITIPLLFFSLLNTLSLYKNEKKCIELEHKTANPNTITKDIVSQYEKIEKKNQYNPYFLFNYGAILCQIGEYEKSITLLEKCTKYVNNSQVQLFLTENFINLKQYDKAEYHALQASYMCPSLFRPLYYLTTIYNQTGQIEKAKMQAQQIIKKPMKVLNFDSSLIKAKMQEYLKNNELP